jgi:hypothetical protein
MNVLERQNVAEHVAFVLTLMVDIIVVAVLVTKIHQAVKKVCRIFYEGRSPCRMAKLFDSSTGPVHTFIISNLSRIPII